MNIIKYLNFKSFIFTKGSKYFQKNIIFKRFQNMHIYFVTYNYENLFKNDVPERKERELIN